MTWAGGGHVPAWLPTQQSAAFRKLKPQSDYVQAAFNAVYDPPGWYTGAGSDFQNAVGATIVAVQSGRSHPRRPSRSSPVGLKTYTTALSPIT